jgi:GT2 family glycosyltransferase
MTPPQQVSNVPEVSVVMSVFNGGIYLADSVESVLAQGGVDLELIAVDDGSQDDSGTLLDAYARRDCRVRVIHQSNTGLTRALARGCAQARGTYIARQDAGDVSLPDRLRCQLEVCRGRRDVVLVSCGVAFVGPRGENLYEVVAGDRAIPATPFPDADRFRGPAHHGCTLLRADALRRVGGYRVEFHLAQDLDLWLRLAEVGSHVAMTAVLYKARFTPDSISGLYRRQQLRAARIAFECARLRRAGLSEAKVLARAHALTSRRRAGLAARARALYFIGACLRARQDPRAREYFTEAVRTWPLNLKLAFRLLFG